MRFWWRGLFAWALLALGACGDDAPTPLMVGTNVWPGYEPFYLAQTQGFYAEKDVRLIQHPSASEVIRAFRNGAIPAAAVTLDEALLMLADGMSVKVVLILDASYGGDVILGQKGLDRIEDLAGRRVGSETSALGAFVLCRAAELHGLDCRRSFKTVNLEIDEQEAAFRDGRIDAVVTFDPVRSRLLEAGARPLFDSREIPDEIIDVLVVRPEVLQNRPRQLNALLTGWFAALDYMKAHRQEAAAAMGKREQLSPEQFLAALGGLRIPGKAENLALLGGRQPGLAQTAPTLARIMSQHGLLPSPVDVTGLLNPAPLEALTP